MVKMAEMRVTEMAVNGELSQSALWSVASSVAAWKEAAMLGPADRGWTPLLSHGK